MGEFLFPKVVVFPCSKTEGVHGKARCVFGRQNRFFWPPDRRNSEGIKGKYFCKFVYEKIQTHNRFFGCTMCSSWE